MTMYKTIPTFILLFTGCLHTNMNVAADTPSPTSSLPTAEATQAPERKIPPHESNPDSSLLTPKDTQVAGISMTVVFLCILVIIGACCVWKKSKGSLVENNSDPCGEPGVALQDFQRLRTNASGLLEAHYANSGSAVA
ncbi:hypothetical protein AV530_012026 [Patagioenas fasciata monilis]|uniref:Uncharacterized protein n=1 Tax=Patagioenas fasciata monilis TaxID=372326 RepID=A0A1V4JV03_PATFA|nr:hypothetical protein AV530_012026 [Patagioenas fasciata monilis]